MTWAEHITPPERIALGHMIDEALGQGFALAVGPVSGRPGRDDWAVWNTTSRDAVIRALGEDRETALWLGRIVPESAGWPNAGHWQNAHILLLTLGQGLDALFWDSLRPDPVEEALKARARAAALGQ